MSLFSLAATKKLLHRRVRTLLMLFVVIQAGCSEPECPPGKKRIGTRCASVVRALDGAVEASTTDDVIDGDQSAAEAVSDTTATVSPDARPRADACSPSIELCNGADDDCASRVDEGLEEAPCDNGERGSCAPVGKLVCMNGKSVCNAPPQAQGCDVIDKSCKNGVDGGLSKACGGAVCDADLSNKGKPCTVDQGECMGLGTWTCDAAANNNALRCSVTRRTTKNLVADSSFEEQLAYSVNPPWTNFKGAYITSDPRTGMRSATVVANDQNGTSLRGYNDINQLVPVVPNTTYKFEAWVKTSANLARGQIGARGYPNSDLVLAENGGYSFGPLTQYTYISTRFTAAPNSTLANIFIGGFDNNGETTVTIDDVVVTRENSCL